jgi:heterodisulfide reductase subunit A
MKEKIGSALIVGAGISGIRSALDLAEMNYRVILIDRAPHIGGTLRQLDRQFPDDHCGMCKMLPLVDRDAASQYCLRKGLFHENIDIMLSTDLVSLEGEPGRFQATLRFKPSLVDPERCMGCGECARVCPVEIPDEFNAGLTLRKAVYLPVPHNIPNHYVVDEAACIRCGECQKVCPTEAIDLKLESRRAFRILVVDDELVVRDSIKEWLEDEGFSVDMAESGVEAVEKLGKREYGLMLLDVKMPGMDGVQVLKAARDMRPELPVMMMTAYATVETAVEAIKMGARDYLMKPFDIEKLVSIVVQYYQDTESIPERRVDVGAVILAAGFESSDAGLVKDTYGYGQLPNVVTSIEFERLLSGTGPSQGKLLRPADGRPAEKIAWLQCVGSRNLHLNADYCSSICCMYSIKEALLAKKHNGGNVDASIFYMDMRTFGKDFQRYRDRAQQEHGVNFIRSRVHSVEPGASNGSLSIVYSDSAGTVCQEEFDMVVLATGQKAPRGTSALAEVAGVELNPWGFCRVSDFSLTRTSRDGVFVSGSFSGLRDISESLIQAGSASLCASALLHSKGGELAEVARERYPVREVSREMPLTALAVCSCGEILERAAGLSGIVETLQKAGLVSEVFRFDRLCTRSDWEDLRKKTESTRCNRVLIGACLPYVYGKKLKELSRSAGLATSLMDVVDIRTPAFPGLDGDKPSVSRHILTAIEMALARLQGVDSLSPVHTEVIRKALVVGGGIAGMTAALAIADHGFHVDLVERSPQLGGNLRTLHRTIEGSSPRDLLERTLSRIEKHPLLTVHMNARVVHSQGRVGRFLTTLEKEDGRGEAIEHGVCILATGGKEAAPRSYCYGDSEAIVTQHELEGMFREGVLDPSRLGIVAMIQCVDSREEGRNYCSRVCCVSALKNALYLKERNPDTDVYILYRDMMTYGFLETYYTQARRAGVIFIRYDLEDRPAVEVIDGRLKVSVMDTVLGRQIILEPGLLVLSTGIVPAEHSREAEVFGLSINEDGFLMEAESKWRPVDFMRQGVFLCGLAHSPRSITESIAMAEAAAQRALGLLCRRELPIGSTVAEVRQSLCSLCERCIAACPYGARWRNEEEDRIEVDQPACQGCGSCAAVCPNGASVILGFRDQQILAVIDAALEQVGG